MSRRSSATATRCGRTARSNPLRRTSSSSRRGGSYAYAFLDPDDDELPPFFRDLCESGYFGDLLYWRVGDRLLAASVGHEDKEQPVVLFAGVTGSAEGFPT
jgi:hypothetical protein